MNGRTLIRFAISAAVFLLFMVHVSGWNRFRLLDTVENFSYDARVRLTLPNTTDKRVVIVDMDEKSLAAEGWPLRRDKLAKLMDRLFDTYHVRVVGFDIAYAEKDQSLALWDQLSAGALASVPGVAERAGQIRQSLNFDDQFGAALKGRPVVLGFFFKSRMSKDEAPTTGAICAPLMDKATASLYAVDFLKALGYGGNIEALQGQAAHCGFFDNPVVDPDGIYRRVPLMQIHDGQVYPSLALAVARLALGDPPVDLEFDPPAARASLNLERVRIGDRTAPVDGDVAVYVPYRGVPYTFKYVSLTDVLNAKADPADLKDTIVLMGATAAGLLDLRSTPVAQVNPGVEVHANIISGLLNGDIRQKAPYYSGIEATMLALIAGIMAWGFSRLSPTGSAAIGLGLMVGTGALAMLMWSAAHFVMPFGVLIVFTLSVLMAHLFYGFFIESRGKREISKLFGQYVPPELVEELASHPEAISMEGESREMTVLFSDVRGFTTISEKLDAKELAQLMNLFLTKQTGIIQKHRGTIDKYMGDAVMAFWGAPLADEQHALNGVLAGMEMITAVRELDEEFRKRGWPPLNIGVGLNTGKMNVGNMGSEFRMAYTVMGDAVNLGSRVEGQTKEYGVAILVTEFTRNLLPGDWAFREIDLIVVKGKNEPVAIYEPLGPKDKLDADLRTDLARHRGAMKLYREQKWDEAETEFFNLSQSGRPQKVYDLMIERIMHYRDNPPGKGWNGAWISKSK